MSKTFSFKYFYTKFNKIKNLALIYIISISSINVFAQNISDCDDFTNGPNETWTHILTATTIADGVASQAEQTFTINVTSLPDGGANFRVYKTTANGNDYFGNLTELTIGHNTFTVSAVNFDRAVKFQFSSGAVGFGALSLNGIDTECVVSPAPLHQVLLLVATSTLELQALWPFVIVAANNFDGVSSQATQTFTMNITSIPDGGGSFRVYKTTANGSDYFGNLTELVLGLNTFTVAAVDFDRTVKFQFSSGEVVFDALNVNGENSNCVLAPSLPTNSLISDCENLILVMLPLGLLF